ncbi:kinase-like domain-containing protein [Trichoderma novae-zelandiae]
MPSFGSFLKKKRTKEGSSGSDPSAKPSGSHSAAHPTSTSSSTSPVASKSLDSTAAHQQQQTGTQPRAIKPPGSSTSTGTAATTTTATAAGPGTGTGTGTGTGAGTFTGAAAAAGLGNHSAFPGALLGAAPPPGTAAASPGSISPSASTPIPASAPALSTQAPAPASSLSPASPTSLSPSAASPSASASAAAAAPAPAARLSATAAPSASALSPAVSLSPTAQPPTMNPALQPPHPYAPGHDSQNLPSISNLINSPQNAGSTNGYPPSPYQTTAPVDAQMADASAQLQQQQQHMPSAMQLDPPHQQQPQHQQPPQQPPQQQPPQQHHQQPQQQQQQQYQQQSQQIHHGHSVSLSQPRVTKGKYSLGDFEILRTLGTGSFGRVHLVQSKHNQRFYAVKVLKKAQVVKMKQVEHTNDERRMLSDVKHPFLITLWGTFQDWKNLYMVMDFVEGGELFSLLRKSGRFPNPVAKFYAAEATLALEYLHSKNIIYRDLKPENLLLDRHGHLKITDFGFAKRVPDKTWTLCGTPDYLAPEVVSNKGYNKSVDWWSLGILIYEMLCGYTPFWDSGSPMRIYENILKGKVKYPAYINPDAQNLLERLITADLTKRLGNLYGGSQDVKNHPWFAEVTWDRLARKDIDAPYTPPVKAGSGDASQFDRYPEDPEKYGGPGGPDEYGNLFTEF